MQSAKLTASHMTRGSSQEGSQSKRTIKAGLNLGAVIIIIMRPSSLGGGRILRRTLSVCPSVCLSVRPVIERHVAPPSELQWHTCTTVLRANIQNRKTSVFAYGPASRMYFSARAEGRISYGHLGRTNSCYYYIHLCISPGVVVEL